MLHNNRGGGGELGRLRGNAKLETCPVCQMQAHTPHCWSANGRHYSAPATGSSQAAVRFTGRPIARAVLCLSSERLAHGLASSNPWRHCPDVLALDLAPPTDVSGLTWVANRDSIPRMEQPSSTTYSLQAAESQLTGPARWQGGQGHVFPPPWAHGLLGTDACAQPALPTQQHSVSLHTCQPQHACG